MSRILDEFIVTAIISTCLLRNISNKGEESNKLLNQIKRYTKKVFDLKNIRFDLDGAKVHDPFEYSPTGFSECRKSTKGKRS